MNISSIRNAALSSDGIIQFLIAVYLSFSLIYTLPLVGDIIIFKQSFFLLLVAFLMLYKDSYKKFIYFCSLIALISIFQLNVMLNTSFEGNIKFLYLIAIAIFFIIYLKEDYIDKYFTKSIIVITFFSALYIFYSYNPNYLKYDIRTYTFGTYSTNWSIGLAFIVLYSIKKNIPITFIAIMYYAQLISGARAGIITTIVGCLILFSIKKEYSKLLLILILTVSYDFIKPTNYLNGNSNRHLLFFHYKSQLGDILSDVNPTNNFPGFEVCGNIDRTDPAYKACMIRIENYNKAGIEKTKPEKTELVRFSHPLFASSAREEVDTLRDSIIMDRLKVREEKILNEVKDIESRIASLRDSELPISDEELLESINDLERYNTLKNKIEKQKIHRAMRASMF